MHVLCNVNLSFESVAPSFLVSSSSFLAREAEREDPANEVESVDKS